jgi:xylulokinase
MNGWGERLMGKILVIDLGTSYFKVSLFDGAGELRGLVSAAVPVESGVPGRCELDAARCWQTVVQAIRRLAEDHDGGLTDVGAITFASQTNSFVLLDGTDRPLTPLILWPDRRAADGEEAMRSWSSQPSFAEETGIPGASHEFMAAKLLWLRRQQPDVWRRTRRLCLISDYLTLRVTGHHVTEAGAAGLTGLVDIHHLCFRDEALQRFQLDADWLPAVVRAGTDLGPVQPQVAEELGLPRDCRFVVGCLDQYAGAIGAGACSAEAITETTGTVLATVRCCDRLTPQPPPVFQGPAFAPGLYYQMVFGEVSANYLEWYRRQLPGRPEFAELTALAAAVEPGAEGLRLRTDVPPTTPEAVFDRCRSSHTRAHFVRCILEAVAVALRNQVWCLAGRSAPALVRCAGGAARSETWLQIKADVLGLPVAAARCPEAASVGAAVLAEATLCGKTVAEVSSQWVQLGRTYTPDPAVHRRYEALFPCGPTDP